MNMTLVYILEGLYFIIIALVLFRIIIDTKTASKTWAYILLVIFLPIVGILIYFSFGVNYRKRKLYDKKLFEDIDLQNQLRDRVLKQSEKVLSHSKLRMGHNEKLAKLLLHESLSPITDTNSTEILVNGESKFPKLLEDLKKAKNHIHLEYYIYEDDEIGNELAELLIKKAKEGVSVKVIYDDFGSRGIRKTIAQKLRANGVKAVPFYEVRLIKFANSLNYRNHRKIVVIDGNIGYVGGINISDRYINKETDSTLFWRDTHIKIEGPAVKYLQYLFISDWNFCSDEHLSPNENLFPPNEGLHPKGETLVQFAASGPDSDGPTILFSLIQAISTAEKEVLITTPYFIPDKGLKSALIIAASSGVDIKLIVPQSSDSKLVDAATRSYFSELLKAGVHIYEYQKGFVHAKTMVNDGSMSMIGTANMDIRSFDLNFEVNAIVYDDIVSAQLRKCFYDDLKHSKKIEPMDWKRRGYKKRLPEKIARLLSSML